MKLQATRIITHHNRGLFSARENAMMKTEIDLNRITSVEIDAINTRKANVVIADVFQTKYIIGHNAFRMKFATRIANAINENDVSQLYQLLSGISVVPNMHIRQMLRNRDEAKKKREIELQNAIKDVTDTISDDELKAIEADDEQANVAA